MMSSNALAAPIAVDVVDELLAVAGGTARIRHHHHVAGRGEHLRVPAIGPALRPTRPAVRRESGTAPDISGPRRNPGGFTTKACTRALIRAFDPELFERRELALAEQRVVQVRERDAPRRPRTTRGKISTGCEPLCSV